MNLDDQYVPLTSFNLIGIAGNSGTGKDTVMNYIANKYIEVYREAFADPLKVACAAAFGINLDDFYDPLKKEVQNPYWGPSPRQIAQFVGTELFRQHIGGLLDLDDNSFWVKRLQGKLTGQSRWNSHDGQYVAGDTVIIPDVRFQDEYDWIVNNGGYIISLQRDGYDGTVGLKNHASEKGFEAWNAVRTYRIFNNSTLEDLHAEVDKAIAYFGIKLVPTKLDLNTF